MNIKAVRRRLNRDEMGTLRFLAMKQIERDRNDGEKIIKVLKEMAHGEKVTEVSNTYATVWLLAVVFADDMERTAAIERLRR